MEGKQAEKSINIRSTENKFIGNEHWIWMKTWSASKSVSKNWYNKKKVLARVMSLTSDKLTYQWCIVESNIFLWSICQISIHASVDYFQRQGYRHLSSQVRVMWLFMADYFFFLVVYTLVCISQGPATAAWSYVTMHICFDKNIVGIQCQPQSALSEYKI